MLSLTTIAADLETRVLETPRLRIRPFHLGDLDDEVAMQLDPRVMKFVRPIEDQATVTARATRYAAKWTAMVGEWIGLSVFARDDGQRVGLLSFRIVDTFDDRAELSYRLHHRFHGRGLAAEATHALIGYLVTFAGVHSLCAVVVADNDKSCRLMERVGMQREGQLRESCCFDGRWHDDVIFGMLATQWRGPSGETLTTADATS